MPDIPFFFSTVLSSSPPQSFFPPPTFKRPALPRPAMKFSAAVLSATLVALASGVAAQLAVLAPGGPNLWMSKSSNSLAQPLNARVDVSPFHFPVAESDNVVTWTCKTSPYPNFAIWCVLHASFIALFDRVQFSSSCSYNNIILGSSTRTLPSSPRPNSSSRRNKTSTAPS